MKNRIYFFFSFSVFLLVASVYMCHFHIKWLPLACFLSGLLLRVVFKSRYLEIFTFLIPILPFFSSFENKGFPLNYLLLPLFLLAGIVAGEPVVNRGRFSPPLPSLPRFYPFYLLLLGTSFFFVMLRWSNLTLSPMAFFKDTLVAPTGQRLSFAVIFPVVEIALFAISPLYSLLLKRRHDVKWVVVAFLSGQSVSILYALLQHGRDKGRVPLPFDGLASDPTSFGFLSALALLLAWYLYSRYSEKWPGFVFAGISLFGIVKSSTRVGLFAILVVFFLLIWCNRKKYLFLILVGVSLLAAFLIYDHIVQKPGSIFLSEMKRTVSWTEKTLQQKTVKQSIVAILSKRDIFWRYSIESLKEYPLGGVGAGNFVFWVMAVHRDKFHHHLPANQYFFVTASTGMIGLLVFFLFCFGLFRRRGWREKWLLGTFLFLFVFNDYLWFAEVFLVFWLFAALGEKHEEHAPISSHRLKVFPTAVFLLFVAAHLHDFSALHPKTWARESSTPYDYGLSYLEREGSRSFRWSGAKAGIYLFPGENGRLPEIVLTCGAPLSRLPGKQQTVDIYWRGEFLKQLAFRKNGEMPLRINDKVHGEGFLEFRVRPSFNLNEMGLGDESRNLGVQVSGKGISDKRHVFTLNFANYRGPKIIRPVDLNKTVFPLQIFRIRGKFAFSLSAKAEEQAIIVTSKKKGRNGEMLILFGLQPNDNNMNIKIEHGRMIIFRAVVRLSKPRNTAAKLVIQDRTNNWEMESMAMDNSGWHQYSVAKRIRGDADKFQCGILWEPQTKDDSMEIKEFQIIVD